MSYDIECDICKGDGELESLFQTMKVCPACRGAGIITVKRKPYTISEHKPFIATTKPATPIDNEIDKVVIVTEKDGKMLSHAFYGTEKYAKEVFARLEKQGKNPQLMTPSEYYKKYGTYKFLPHVKIVSQEK